VLWAVVAAGPAQNSLADLEDGILKIDLSRRDVIDGSGNVVHHHWMLLKDTGRLLPRLRESKLVPMRVTFARPVPFT